MDQKLEKSVTVQEENNCDDVVSKSVKIKTVVKEQIDRFFRKQNFVFVGVSVLSEQCCIHRCLEEPMVKISRHFRQTELIKVFLVFHSDFFPFSVNNDKVCLTFISEELTQSQRI